ncbi:hypothetical protein Lser_V15G43306 [Lactuca serriola]
MNLQVLKLRSNLFEGISLYRNAKMNWLDISGNHMIGTILDNIPKFFPNIKYLNLSMNALSGVIPSSNGELSELEMLDLSCNGLSGEVPKGLFTGTMDTLILSKNKLHGQILSGNLSWGYLQWVYLDNNHFTGKIGNYNKERPVYLIVLDISNNFFTGVISEWISNMDDYKGGILDYMAGFEFSCNKLTGEIPEELGLLTQLRALNLSHNHLTGPIPVNLSNLAKIESLDLSSNGLTGKVPIELIKLTSLSIFNLSHNNLSGRLPEMKAQFGTFMEESYEGNPLLCGPPLENKCRGNAQVVTNPWDEEDNEKWV